jgi:hypothetical protein
MAIIDPNKEAVVGGRTDDSVMSARAEEVHNMGTSSNQQAALKYKTTVEDVPDELMAETKPTDSHKSALPKNKKRKGTKGWVMNEVQEGEERGLKALRKWVQQSRLKEVNPELCKELRALDEKRMGEALKGLWKKRRWVQGRGGNSLVLPIQLQALDTLQEMEADALLDSGATGSYIGAEFVRQYGLQTEDLPHAMPVYNADGSPNKAGPIRHVLRTRVRILDHTEIMTLAVTNTGKHGVIIGFDWLRRHNPMVDWARKAISLDRCPAECFRQAFQGNLDDERRVEEQLKTVEEGWQEKLEEGDRLFVTRIYSEEYVETKRVEEEEEMRWIWRKEAGIGENHQKKPRRNREVEESLRRRKPLLQALGLQEGWTTI